MLSVLKNVMWFISENRPIAKTTVEIINNNNAILFKLDFTLKEKSIVEIKKAILIGACFNFKKLISELNKLKISIPDQINADKSRTKVPILIIFISIKSKVNLS